MAKLASPSDNARLEAGPHRRFSFRKTNRTFDLPVHSSINSWRKPGSLSLSTIVSVKGVVVCRRTRRMISNVSARSSYPSVLYVTMKTSTEWLRQTSMQLRRVRSAPTYRRRKFFASDNMAVRRSRDMARSRRTPSARLPGSDGATRMASTMSRR